VSSVIRSTWPVPRDFSRADPAVLENARLRGVETDELFCRYIGGTLDEIPAGTRKDVWNPDTGTGLLQKLIPWWDKQGLTARTQVILHDDEIAGTADIVTDDMIMDLKCTYNLESTYELQLAAYLDLDKSPGTTKRIAIIHCTERFDEPRLVVLPQAQCFFDWGVLRDMWAMVRRRTQ